MAYGESHVTIGTKLPCQCFLSDCPLIGQTPGIPIISSHWRFHRMWYESRKLASEGCITCVSNFGPLSCGGGTLVSQQRELKFFTHQFCGCCFLRHKHTHFVVELLFVQFRSSTHAYFTSTRAWLVAFRCQDSSSDGDWARHYLGFHSQDHSFSVGGQVWVPTIGMPLVLATWNVYYGVNGRVGAQVVCFKQIPRLVVFLHSSFLPNVLVTRGNSLQWKQNVEWIFWRYPN